MKKQLLFLHFLILGLSTAFFAPAQSSEDGAWLSLHGKKVLFYQKETKALDGRFPRADYVHPLYGPDGFVITEDFPKDHLHQRGIYWAWHQILIGDKRVGDAWVCDNFIWDVKNVRVVQENEDEVSLYARTLWKSPLWPDAAGKQKPFMEEKVIISVRQPAGGYRVVDFTISLLALEENVKIGGSDNAKGYGGFSVRMKMPDDLKFYSTEGEVTPQVTQVKAGPWMNISGSLANSGKGGVVIMCHPGNPGYPGPWILRKKGSMQNPAWPGREPVDIPSDKPTMLRYRLVVYEGTLNKEEIEAVFRSFMKNN